jgi:hypothetical protein
MKIVLMLYHLLALLTLMVFAALQLNDSPLLWGGFYSCCALIPLLVIFRVESRILWLLYSVCVIYGIVVLVPAVDGFFEYLKHEDSLLSGMSADRPYIKEGREFLGALIAVGMCALSLVGRKLAAIAQVDSA